jgi:hypothetical protein
MLGDLSERREHNRKEPLKPCLFFTMGSRRMRKQNIVTLSEVETSQLIPISGFDSAHPDGFAFFNSFFRTLLVVF